MGPQLIYLILLSLFVVLGSSVQHECHEEKCRHDGPVIRFPFRLKDRHQQHCGYPGFELHCTHNKDTVLELPFPVKASIKDSNLPFSVQFSIKEIDYKNQLIKISKVFGCLPELIPFLNLSASPFQFSDAYRDNFTFFNCSKIKRDDLYYLYPVTCLSIYKGKLSNDVFVAIKILNNSKGNGEDFINEVGTIGRIHHVNVVRLVGYCADGFTRALVYEFLPNDSPQKFISSEKQRCKLGWEKLHQIAVDIAKGVEYLHQGCEQRILHFDIKPNNILLDDNLNPKISDFGIAKFCSKEQSIVSMTAARGTIGYIAPEVSSRNFGNVSYKSDVYSFGVLLLEMVGGLKKK
ncbi:rust resistance kinase Lr10-like [Olea europaea subsp. europaea]|uniref:non-specific serine/threonine protein kinase n=1 Tax=Olea europaea subsp. europaea TaxID=158383 RepID=A0A8S0UP16_OLEEU|nr:rust resistance kinase Lr10-like [Olea europaea subsp. europaea]